jgi:hypothetical protein
MPLAVKDAKATEERLEMHREATAAERQAAGMTDEEARKEAMKMVKTALMLFPPFPGRLPVIATGRFRQLLPNRPAAERWRGLFAFEGGGI